MLQHIHWGDWWMGPFAKYWGPGRRAPDWCTPDTVCRNGAQTRQTGFTILCYSATIYQWMSAVSGILFQLLTVAAIRGPRLKLLLCIFCVTKFAQNFLRWHVKEIDVLKILAACHSGAPFQPGALRTCVPCLMVNPALELSHSILLWCTVIQKLIHCTYLVMTEYFNFTNSQRCFCDKNRDFIANISDSGFWQYFVVAIKGR